MPGTHVPSNAKCLRNGKVMVDAKAKILSSGLPIPSPQQRCSSQGHMQPPTSNKVLRKRVQSRAADLPQACRSRSASGSAKCGSSRSESTMKPVARNAELTPRVRGRQAFSADRALRGAANGGGSPATPPSLEFLRWPRPNEHVLSKSGSPLVSRVLPIKFANVNIPTKHHGTLSVGPKKLTQLPMDFIGDIGADTLRELRMLNQNLKEIVNLVDTKRTRD